MVGRNRKRETAVRVADGRSCCCVQATCDASRRPASAVQTVAGVDRMIGCNIRTTIVVWYGIARQSSSQDEHGRLCYMSELRNPPHVRTTVSTSS